MRGNSGEQGWLLEHLLHSRSPTAWECPRPLQGSFISTLLRSSPVGLGALFNAAVPPLRPSPRLPTGLFIRSFFA